MTGSIPPPPAWHPDPYGEKAWRWWDGSRWTEHAADPIAGPDAAAPWASAPIPGWSTAPAYPAYPAYPTYPAAYPHPGSPSGPATTAQGSLSAELAVAPWAERAFVWYLVVVATGILVAWAESSSVRQIFHDLRVQTSTGVVQPQLQQTAARDDLLSLVTLAVSAPFYVALLMWQYRAARMARQLWLPAAHSAGLGVGSWFIPVVNLWFPYQSLRDCLPPGHPGRALIGRLWTCFISTVLLTLVTEVLAWAGSTVGFAFAGATLGAGAGFAYFGVRSVRSIAASHRDLLGPGPERHAAPGGRHRSR